MSIALFYIHNINDKDKDIEELTTTEANLPTENILSESSLLDNDYSNEYDETTETRGDEEPDADAEINSYTEMPSAFSLDLEIIYQNPELPAGCESVSLSMLLNYYGYELYKTEIADNYLIYSSSYLTGYYGDPYSSIGGGCYSPGMTDTANSFLQANGNEYYAENITGTPLEDLFVYISNGTPVLIWTTISMGACSKEYSSAEYLSGDDTPYYWDYMEHCVVLTGYDIDNGTVTVYDPIDGVMTRDREQFEYIYDEMYRMSVVLVEME